MINEIIENKQILSIADFDNLEWNDCKIYGFAFDDANSKLYIDLDLIVGSLSTTDGGNGLGLRVTPSTLVFNNVRKLVLDIETDLSLEVENVSKENPHYTRGRDISSKTLEYDWTIELEQGDITFCAVDFELYIRKSLDLEKIKSYGFKERGGISFSTDI